MIASHYGFLVVAVLSLFASIALQARIGHAHQGDDDEYVASLDTGCAGCISAVGLLKTLVQAGNATDEEIMDAVVDVCYRLVPDEGWNPDTLCDLAIDTYAPHVIYIFNVTDKSASDICILYNSCMPPNDTTTAYVPLRRPPVKINQGHRIPERAVSDTSAAIPLNDYPGSIRILHLTDMHTDYLYAEGSPAKCDMPLCCREEYNGTGSAGYWGDYECNIPHRTVDLILSSIYQQFEPQLVLYTGDTVQHTVWDSTYNQTVEVSAYLTDRIATHFPNTPAFFAIGNHDTHPANLFYIERQEVQDLNAVMYTHWQELSELDAEHQATFEEGIYYSKHIHSGLRVISYNSIYGTLDNFYNILNVDEQPYKDMQQFMEDSLAAARLNNEKVIFLGHHPTGSGGMIREYSEFITDIQSRYADVIILHLMGHSHGDKFTLVTDISTDEIRGVQLSSPATTSYTNNNPSFRILYLDSTTYQVLDMDTYHLDINADKDNPAAAVKFVYRATTEYNMTDLSPQSFNDLVDRMEPDRSLLEQYRYNKETRVIVPAPCDDECAHDELCELRYSDLDRRQQCSNDFTAAPAV